MSYLPGPLTRDQISILMEPHKAITASAVQDSDEAVATPFASTTASQAAPPTPVAPPLADDETTVSPRVADGVAVAFADPAAAWAVSLGATSGGHRLVASLVCRVRLLFDESVDDLRHESEWEAVASPLSAAVSGDDFVHTDYDDRDLRDDSAAGSVYVVPDAKIHTKTFFTKAQRALKDRLYREETLHLFANPGLKLYSRVGETKSDFELRCNDVADDRADAEADKLRETMAKKQDRVKAAIGKAEDRIRELQSDTKDRKRNEMLSGAIDLVGGLLGGRKSSRSIMGGLRRASGKRRMTSNAGQRVETAKNRLEENIDKLEDLADALEDSLGEIRDEWEGVAVAIDEREVALEKTDITVEDLRLVWIPTE